MKFAYADPPYIGCANLYPEKREVDHESLIARLVAEYPDGWALSCHSPSLKTILPLCPQGARVMAWTKSFAAFKKRVRPQYAWEPVVLCGGRPLDSGGFTCVRDFHHEMPTVFSGEARGLNGMKSRAFCSWILECLGYQEGDTVDDMFPGTGTMAMVIAQVRFAL